MFLLMKQSVLHDVLVLVTFLPLGVFGYGFSKLRREISSSSGERVQVMQEIISSIAAIKLFTWEKLFIVILETKRK